ncbi:hypothetical protein Fot_40946 [Forsythia ovata]|uniref:Uncharacterized protein n=2 Tax=Forsythia ovata TaxID=205694 RepID=A0ABD1RGU9_9LAMI
MAGFRCLDMILHAEHKSILEEMRSEFDLTLSTKSKGVGVDVDDFSGLERNFVANGKGSDTVMNKSVKSEIIDKENKDEANIHMPIPFNFTLDLSFLLGSLSKTVERNPIKASRFAVPIRFQHAFLQLLYNAEFEELSPRDLMLTSALNSDYLLTLPINVDWKRSSESGAIIFRRGYATERQKGLLIVEKLDYLQSKLLQNFFFLIAKPLGRVGVWINEVLKNISQKQDTEVLAKNIKLWLNELTLFQQPFTLDEQMLDNLVEADLRSNDFPIWLAAERAVTRYEGILSAVGPRERLLRKFLMWIGLVPSTPEQAFDLDSDSTNSESHLRPNFLSRITLSDIWKPASPKYCGNDFWKMLRTGVSILFSQSILQEPAFEELILLYTEEIGERETEDKAEISSLQMKIYEKIPIPDLPVVFPHKKLSFRILDTVRLDVATTLGLLAFVINYKFENILSSPSAILLDVIAVSALVIYVTRVLLGYKQTRDRYQLLVNKTLYEKTVASGFGSIHFLLDASEQQQYKEAILAYAILLKAESSQVTDTRTIRDKCERFIYNVFQGKVEMPVDKAIKTLVRLGLVIEKVVDEQIVLQAIPCRRACVILQNSWNSLLSLST